MKVKLEFQSPLIVGGKKQVNNYIESIDYIQGNVMRAALARYILNNCSEYSSNDTIVVDGVKRKNWVYYRGKEGCKNCRLKSVCEKFSTLKFSYFYPKNVSVIPLTAMMCKKYEEHGFIDSLIEEKKCPYCESDEDNRVESVSGYVKDNRKYSVKKVLLTKTEIDKYTSTSKDGSLYTIVAISETSKNKNVFEGYIYGLTEDDLKLIEELRVGKYQSVGFGKCILQKVEEGIISKSKTLQDLNNFNEKYKKFNNLNTEKNYFAVKFVGDAKVRFEKEDKEYITTNEYKEIWRKSLGIDKKFVIHKVIAEISNFRGYDTSKVEEDKREETVYMVEKGSVIVFETGMSIEDLYNYFIKLDGFGEENENGFGKFKFHLGGVN